MRFFATIAAAAALKLSQVTPASHQLVMTHEEHGCTAEDVAIVRAVAKGMDRNGDEKVTEQELKEALEWIAEHAQDFMKEVLQHMRKANTTKDGHIDQAELAAALEGADEETVAFVTELFNLLDLNGDSNLAFKEVKAVKKALAWIAKNPEQAEAMFHSAAGDDAELTAAELDAALAAHGCPV